MEDERKEKVETTAEVAISSPSATEPKPKKARAELKVNIIIKGDHIFLAAQATDTDPKMMTFTGDLPAVLARIPAFVEECNAQWDIAAHNPKAAIPEPVPTAAPPRTATTTSSSASKPAAVATKPPAQPKFF